MGLDLCFKTAPAIKAGFKVQKMDQSTVDDYGVWEHRVLKWQDVGGWMAIIVPFEGRSIVRDKPASRAALLAAGIPFEEC